MGGLPSVVELERERVELDERETDRAGTRSGRGGGHRDDGDRHFSSSSSSELSPAAAERGPAGRIGSDSDSGSRRSRVVVVGLTGGEGRDRDREGTAGSDRPPAAAADEVDFDRPCFPFLADLALDTVG